jgi:hypothetical protein
MVNGSLKGLDDCFNIFGRRFDSVELRIFANLFIGLFKIIDLPWYDETTKVTVSTGKEACVLQLKGRLQGRAAKLLLVCRKNPGIRTATWGRKNLAAS